MHTNRHRSDTEAGFSLVETLIAMAILATGLLSLAGVFAMGLNHLATSSANLSAREKAREAVESVHTARDTRTITWCQIYNEDSARPASCNGQPAGVFVTGEKPLREPGVDGLVNTADDDDAPLEVAIEPGPDNRLGTDDDVRKPLDTYTRQIEISEILTNGNANPNLRRIRVTIRYGKIGYVNGEARRERSYVLTTYISSIS